MNAPYDPALIALARAEAADAPVDGFSVMPHSVRISSLSLGWYPLNIERRELEPGDSSLPGGTKEHLICVSLAEGHCVRESGGEVAESDLAAGLVSVLPSETPVRWSWDTRLSIAVMALEPEYLDKVARETFDLDPAGVRLRIVEGQRDPLITGIAGNLMREAMNGDAGSRLFAESLAGMLAVHLLRNYSERPQPIETDRISTQPRAVTQAVDFIHDNYPTDLSLSDIAAAAHLSPFHLSRIFKKATGVTPHQYLLQVRVNSARSLLTAGAGDRSLAEVATAVGFADQSHLTRHFKRMLGVTPKQLRQ
ncbi:MAG TPA: AraC family transcriptional regulator [Burkholderiales bacterium]|nr:AraC family transcriptional regulator [Burkholderiales bacterium]